MIQLSFPERMTLELMLPTEGNYELLKQVQSIHSLLEISETEKINFKIQTLANGNLYWHPSLNSVKHTISTLPFQEELIAASLKQYEIAKKLPYILLPLFELLLNPSEA